MPTIAPVRRRWIALVFIALAQLMVVLDATVVNIALPSAQRALRISAADRQWIITAYTLAFGGLLLFGGRVGDLAGRKRMFLAGLVGFAGASALGGAARNEVMLVGARALQGMFGALLAPSALSLLAVTFTLPKERAKAFGVYGAIAGGGAAIGLILGGVLTEYLNWRWALYVNVPIAAVGFAGGLAFIREPAASRNRSRLDVPGVVLVTAGLVALVYGFTRAESEGWRERGVLGLFGAAVVLLTAFVIVEALSRAPLLPLRVVLDRNRGGAYLAVALSMIGMFGLFLFMTYYLQTVKGFSPIRAGLAFLPMTAGMIVGATQISARLMNHVAARVLMTPGLLVAAGGIVLLTRLRVDSAYVAGVLPAESLLGLGLGTTFMPAMNLATVGVDPRDAGVASAMVNTSQQVGGSIGTALLNTVAATATTDYLAAHARGLPPPILEAVGLVRGFTVALWWGVGVLALAALVVAVLINAGGRRPAPARADGRREAVAEETTAAEFVSAGASRLSGPPPGSGAPAAMTAGTPPRSPSAEGPAPVDEDRRGYARDTTWGPAAWGGSGASGDGGSRGGEGRGAYGGSQGGGIGGAYGGGSQGGGAGASGSGDAGGAGGTYVYGRVRRRDGVPVAHAMVTLIDLGGRQLGRTSADGDGGYALAAPRPGTYMVVAVSDGYRPQAATVLIAAESIVHDVTLSGAARLTGVVRGGPGAAPVAGAMLVVTDAGGDVVASVTTGADGTYSVGDLVAGTYVVAASADGHRPAARQVEVTDQDVTRCDVELKSGARVRGTVRADRDGRPLPDARVTLVDAVGNVVASAITGAGGEYAFHDLEPGPYTLVASGYPPVAAAVVVGAGDGEFGLTLSHPDGGSR